MYSTSVEPSNFYARWHGFPLPASNIISLPLAFVRSGYIHLAEGYLNYVGYSGYDWSRVSSSDIYAYYLTLSPSNATPSYPYFRWLSFPLRCLRMLEGTHEKIV